MMNYEVGIAIAIGVLILGSFVLSSSNYRHDNRYFNNGRYGNTNTNRYGHGDQFLDYYPRFTLGVNAATLLFALFLALLIWGHS